MTKSEVKFDDNTVILITLDRLQQFKGHAFKPYKGKKLAQLTKSIKDNGVMQHIIVRPAEGNKFEIISGHNRAKAAKEVGLSEIPAIIRELTDEEAIILANEMNITQRSFKDWLPSERAASIKQYHDTISQQGKRLISEDPGSGGNSQKQEDYARIKTASVYGVKGNIIRLYMEIYNLNAKLMDRLDNEEFGVTAAQQLSFISQAGQLLINEILDGDKESYKVTVDKSVLLRGLLEGYKGENTSEKASVAEEIRTLLAVSKNETPRVKSSPKVKNIPFDDDQYERLFSGLSENVAAEIIITAMEFYNGRKAETAEIGTTVDPPEVGETIEDTGNSKTNDTDETTVPSKEHEIQVPSKENMDNFPRKTKPDEKSSTSTKTA